MMEAAARATGHCIAGAKAIALPGIRRVWACNPFSSMAKRARRALAFAKRLAGLPGITLRSIDPTRRKDPAARREMFASVDLAILCLPDEAAKEAVALADALPGGGPKIIDASTAHRTHPDWTFGFPEISLAQAKAIATARRVANPGCYSTGAIALLRPLIDAGVLDKAMPVAINAVSGFTGGGKSMIEAYAAGTAPAFELYGLGFQHKHIPEIMRYGGLQRRPIFIPSVGNFAQGMLVSLPLHLSDLAGGATPESLRRLLATHYAGSEFLRVAGTAETEALGGRIEPQALNDSNRLELFVFGSADQSQAVLVARLDNLGKGASGAAVQNMKIMFG